MRKIKFRQPMKCESCGHIKFRYRWWDEKKNDWDWPEFLVEKDQCCKKWRYHPVGNTIEQFTGLLDKNGDELDWWEGDLFELFSDYHLYEIVYDKGCFWFKSIRTTHRIQVAETLDWGDMPKKIGNIHSNPELLEAKND